MTSSEGGAVERRGFSIPVLLDQAFFILGGVAAVLLAVVLVDDGLRSGWAQIGFYVAVWVLVAYLALPRLHRILTRLYVPDYFIGRARTSDGLLGDPVNLALHGSDAQLVHAMTSAGWTRADEVTLRSSWRIVVSTLTRRSYHEAPVSPLFVFGRQQDVAFQQEVAGNPAKRHHVRFWRCPDGWLLPGGFPAEWVAAGTFDRSVGLSLFTLQVTHKISPDTDRERDHIVATLVARHPEAVIDVIRDFSTGYHARNGGGDSIVTDGDLPVVDLRAVPIATATATIEPAASTELAGPGTRSTRPRRPATTRVGALMLVARALAYALQTALLLTGVASLDDLTVLDGGSSDGTPTDADTTRIVAAAVLGAAMLVWLVLGALVLRGSATARLLALSSSVLSTLAAFTAVLQGGAAISLQTNLGSVAFDILVLLALSSRSSRDFAAARSRDRRSRRRRTGHATG
ncbi:MULTISPECIES: LssY C-terminal domain-containing protein [unclassified Rathayibacter]|uniref:LssY C-terminal domain-containing protein n=1 Tax=unclassified Rathayibacter TaxID=2609250 RepID=UPI00188B4B3C|nr:MULTISPECIES: LssY C-terminal domain-containing protein [unclassified Rathayibacter]MBF4463188.1 LssY C-terminal domain-containing protein [Rathayibacter sp. VKM Ac-2879]MBF4504575.1 LssY C-terminal domain-containing protein [Rathayibacter sp. VKM Ac-2878]